VPAPCEREYIGRAGHKLKHAIDRLDLELRGMVAADFGCNVGGFTDCLLKEGVARVYAVDTGYGVLDWRLRNDPRVVVMERTNAMHIELERKVNIITIDVAWTRQRHILPNALAQLKSGGIILSLFKPQYEADPRLLRGGVLPPEEFEAVLGRVLDELREMDIAVVSTLRLPRKHRSKNREGMLFIKGSDCRF